MREPGLSQDVPASIEPAAIVEPAASRHEADDHGLLQRVWRWIVGYFQLEPRFSVALAPALLIAAVVFTRNPMSNYIFDEQEALLANPYVNSDKYGFLAAFERDFWGLPPSRSIGSYRPIPNLIWRSIWYVSEAPWLHHWVNIVVHAMNAALLASFAFALTRRKGMSWLCGAAFLLSAVLTESVTGVVGAADVFAGLFVLLGLHALRLRAWLMPVAVVSCMTLSLFSKESGLVAVPLMGWAALVTAPVFHRGRPWRLLRGTLAVLAATLALVGYTYFRREFFPVSLPTELVEPLPADEPLYRRALHEFLRWFQQPRLPRDPINNPLALAEPAERIAGAFRVYARGLGQIVLPWQMSGDYSYPQEPIPTRLVTIESVLGGLSMVVPPLLGVFAWLQSLRIEWRLRRQTATPLAQNDVAPRVEGAITSNDAALGVMVLFALALVWFPLAYFPHSNIPVLLPTVRAERFWYLPAFGTALVVGWGLARLCVWRPVVGFQMLIVFLGFQALMARTHALHYSDDLVFWRATREVARDSAKAHLNYAVMVGARGDLEERLEVGQRAKDLAPDWPMAHVYLGDTLCRMNQPHRAWRHYRQGFSLAPNDSNLIALGLQCLWDKKGIESQQDELLDLAAKHPGSWLSYLATEIVHNGAKHGGVEPKYRPRGYNQGPKE